MTLTISLNNFVGPGQSLFLTYLGYLCTNQALNATSSFSHGQHERR